MAIKVALAGRLPDGKTTLAIILTQIALMKHKRVLAFDLNKQNDFNVAVSYMQNDPNFKDLFKLKTVLTEKDFYSPVDWIIIDCPSISSSSGLDENIRLALQNSDFILLLVGPLIYSMDSRRDLFSLMYLSENLRRECYDKEPFQFPLVKIDFTENLNSESNAIIKERYSQYPVIGNLPHCKTIIENISSNRKKCRSVGLSALARQPFESVYTRLELFHRKLQELRRKKYRR